MTIFKTAAKTGGSAKKFIFSHPYWSGLGAVVIIGLAWWGIAAATRGTPQTRYVLGTVSSSTIVSTVSASGQISSSDSIDIKPKVSGDVTWVGVTQGQTVHAGQALVSIDDTDAEQTLKTAQENLATDELNFQKSQAQAPIDYQNDLTALANAKEALSDDYNDTFNELTGVYLDLPDIMSGAQNTLYGYDFDSTKNQWNMDFLSNLFTTQPAADTANMLAFKDSAKNDFVTAQTSYNAAVAVYKTTTRASDTDDIDALLAQSISMMEDVAQSLQTELNFLGAVSDLAQTYNITLPAKFTTVQSTARTELSTANSDLSSLLSQKKTLDGAKQAITADQQTVTLDQVGNTSGDNPISLQVSANSLEQEKQNVATLEADLADYTVVAPFSGTVSAVDVAVGDAAGSSAVASVISNEQVADLSLNEVDAAKIAVGQKATLTFDAIPNLTLTGTVAEIDSVGTVSQGVVTYAVKISLDTQDSRIKPGMSVDANIQTSIAQNALTVPASAIKTLNGQSYVLVFNPPLAETGGTAGVTSSAAPMQVPVTVGISDNTNTQILSGLTLGEQIVVRTVTGSTAATTATARTTTTGAAGARAAGGAGFGGGFGGGGAIRIGG